MVESACEQPIETYVRAERVGALGLLTLDRPKALNALNETMIASISDALEDWASDDRVAHVAVLSTSERAFCAGGDIRSVAEASYEARTRGVPPPTDFFRKEYRLNYLIKTYPKPYIALINGIVMGGGVGLSVHGSHRIVCEDLRFAMPEVGIGFFPDVGGTYVLPRLNDHAGAFLALTGLSIGWRDSLALDLATHATNRSSFAGIVERLSQGEAIETILEALEPLQLEAAPSHLPPVGDLIACFDQPSVEAVLEAVSAQASAGIEWAARALEAMKRASPTSLKLAFAQLKRGKDLDFAETMKTEFRIVSRILMQPDFYEGVRALIIDKDRSPVWAPKILGEVRGETIEAYFQPVGEELDLT